MTDSNNEATKQMNKLNELQQKGTTPLLTIQTVFPFKFFPCILTLDRQKITRSESFFFSSKEVENYLVEEIVSITSVESLFFATLTMVTGVRINKEVSVPFLRKEDARKMRRLVEGLLIAGREGIDVNKIPAEQLIQKVEEIGSAKV